LGQVFQKRTDEFHFFTEQVGKQRWKIGSDWLAGMLSMDTRQLITEEELSKKRKDWQCSQRVKVWRMGRDVAPFRKRYDELRSTRRIFLRKKLDQLLMKKGLDPSTKWFSTLEKTVMEWEVEMPNALFALELSFPKLRFDGKNPLVALSAFLMFAR